MKEKHDPTPWTVTLPWKGETVVCIGGGPSLTEKQIADTVGYDVRLIGVNDAYRVIPWADVLYACDLKWWNWHHDRVFSEFEGILVSTDKVACSRWPRIKYLPGEHKEGLSWDPKLIHYGFNSGYQAVNIAVLSGASRVLLIGYDHNTTATGMRHWFGDHPDSVQSSYDAWIQKAWPTVPPSLKGHGCEVINCSPRSSITAFPHLPLREALEI